MEASAAPRIPGTGLFILLWQRWERTLFAQACTSRNPFLVHELNLIRRDNNFWRMNALFLLSFWFFFYRAPNLLLAYGPWILEEGFSLIALALCTSLLTYRLRRPHIRYNGENAVFLCVLPMDGAQLLAAQTVAVLFQPVMLLIMVLPMAVLLVGVGMVNPATLLLKIALVIWILFLMALFGVARVPRQWLLFLGFPLALVVLPIGGVLLIMMLAQLSQTLIEAIAGQSYIDTNEIVETVAFALGAIYLVLLAPVLVLLAALNPLWTYIVQTTELARAILGASGPLAAWTVPWSTVFSQLFGTASSGSPGLTGATKAASGLFHAYDTATTALLFRPTNWIALVALNTLYLRDAWLRGADQFEYFRVRGYPERFRDYRLLERDRVRSRNLRIRGTRFWKIGQFIDARSSGSQAHGNKALVAFLLSPFHMRDALRAMAMHPEDYQTWHLDRWSRRQTRRERVPRRRATAAPPVVAAPATVAPPVDAVATLTPAVSIAVPIDPPHAPAERIAPASEDQVVDRSARRRGLPHWLTAITRAPNRALLWLIAFLTRLLPEPVRNNAVFGRDWAFFQAILSGKREGIWSYSWTVLLTINLLISTFVYLMWCFTRSLLSLVQLAAAANPLSNVETVDLTWPVGAAVWYLRWLFVTLPLFFLALPIYAYLKERARPDWESYALTSQTGSNMLLGKWAFFMVLGGVLLVALALLAVILNPLLIGSPFLLALNPAAIDLEVISIAPVWTLLYFTTLLGMGALYYQVAQVAYFTGLCLNWRRGSGMAGTLTMLGCGIVFLFTAVAVILADAEFGFLRGNWWWDAFTEGLMKFFEAIAQILMLLSSYLSRITSRAFPVTPWELYVRFWQPGGSGAENDLTWLEAVYLIVTYWGLALVGHWRSSALFETRLRSDTPHYFAMARRRRRKKVQEAG